MDDLLLIFEDLVGYPHRLYSVQVAEHGVDVFLSCRRHRIHGHCLLVAGLERSHCSSLQIPSASQR